MAEKVQMVWVPPGPGGGTRHTNLRERLKVSRLNLAELAASDEFRRYVDSLDDEDAIVLELPHSEDIDTDAAAELARAHDRDIVLKVVDP